MIRILAPALALACLSGCALDGPAASYVAPVLTSQGDAQALAASIASVAEAALPPGPGAVWLEPPASGQDGGDVGPALTAILGRNGFRIAEAPEGAHRLRYWLTPLDQGDLVRVAVDGAPRAACVFARAANGTLQPASPITLEAG